MKIVERDAHPEITLYDLVGQEHGQKTFLHASFLWVLCIIPPSISCSDKGYICLNLNTFRLGTLDKSIVIQPVTINLVEYSKC